MCHESGKRIRNENGAVAVISAFFMIAAIGFMALSIDRGQWLSDKRKFQNASDSAALTACTKYFKDGASEEEAEDAGKDMIYQNGVSDSEIKDLSFSWTDTGVEVKLTCESPNYFSSAFTKGGNTEVYVHSTAGTEQKIIKKTVTNRTGSEDTPYNGAIESGKNFNWQGWTNNSQEINGNMDVEGAFTMTSPIHVNGNVRANDSISIQNGSADQVINGSLYSGKKITITQPFSVTGDLKCNDDITWNTNGGKIGGNIISNKNICLQAESVGGNVEALGNITSNTSGYTVIGGDLHANGSITGSAFKMISGNMYAGGAIGFNNESHIGKDVRSNTSITANWCDVCIGGTYYDKGGITGDMADKHLFNADKTGRPVTVSDVGVSAVPDVVPYQYIPYDFHTKWDPTIEKIRTMCSSGENVLTVTQEMAAAYAKAHTENGWANTNYASYSGGSITFNNGDNNDPQAFFDFCRDYADDHTDDPIYIDGSLTVNGSLSNKSIHEKLIVKDSFTANQNIDLTGCIISLNGNITLGNGGSENSVTGTCGLLVCSGSGNIQLNNGGTITGGIISAGNLTMNGTWSIDASSTWGSGIIKTTEDETSTEETTETVVTNIRLVK